MKKLIFILIFFYFSNEISSQNFKLKEPNIFNLKEQLKTNSDTNVIFNYLINNYKTISEKTNLEYHELNDSQLCGFKQEFENGIKYTISECKEASGVFIELELPKIKRSELKKWIEIIYKIDKTEEDKNVWKNNNSKFEPKEVEPGCYYKIEEKNKKTFIELYCGC
jgi:hypothetical protein